MDFILCIPYLPYIHILPPRFLQHFLPNASINYLPKYLETKTIETAKAVFIFFVEDFGAFVVGLFGDEEEGEGAFGVFPGVIRRCVYGALLVGKGGGV